MEFFSRIKDSFTNFETYNEIAVQRRGKTFKYFFVLFTLLFIIGSLRLAYDFNVGTSAMIEAAGDKIPEFKFADGELQVEGQQPIIIEGENNTVLIIDTTGKTSEAALDKYNEGAFISRHTLVAKQNFETRVIRFSNFKNFSLDKDKLIGLLPMFKWIIVPVGAVLYIFALVWALVTTALLAAVGSFMVKRQIKDKVDFAKLWNISVYALTLPWLLDAAKNLVFPGLPFFFIIKWAAALIILNKAIEAVNNRFSDSHQPPGDVLT